MHGIGGLLFMLLPFILGFYLIKAIFNGICDFINSIENEFMQGILGSIFALSIPMLILILVSIIFETIKN
jgi:hypothetical protein